MMQNNNSNKSTSVIERSRSAHFSRAIANILEPSWAKNQTAVEIKDSTAVLSPQEDKLAGEQKILPFPQQPSNVAAMDFVSLVSVDKIQSSPFQTRQHFSEEEIKALAASIQAKGVLQPILIRPKDSDRFELIAGERRLRAAQLAGCREIPAQVLECDDSEAAQLALVENLQRENLNPIEEARAYSNLIAAFSLTQKDVAELVGKSRAVITNSMRLLNLHPNIVVMIEKGDLTAGHGKVLLGVDDQKIQLRLANKAVSAGLSVRNLELILEYAQQEKKELSDDEKKLREQLVRLESKIKGILDLEGAKLQVDDQGRKRLHIIFASEAEWKRFLARFK
ncbi:MAG: ParB/RepB/Spo0J family partition protein [Deltaproteobacteria bacterium]|nr:ParB/RepB/Spo0J family partition protein [Deltaproteobacteria bacterium]